MATLHSSGHQKIILYAATVNSENLCSAFKEVHKLKIFIGDSRSVDVLPQSVIVRLSVCRKTYSDLMFFPLPS